LSLPWSSSPCFGSGDYALREALGSSVRGDGYDR
jgi:hypothetical protein